MYKQAHIQFIKHQNIDKSKYDECIIKAENSLIYARSFYLDQMCPQWDALFGDDYSWVMPITYNRKWGIKYLYQPEFTQQSGVFQQANATVPFQQILTLLKEKFSFWEVSFNYFSPLNINDHKLYISKGTNYILSLNTSYESIENNYHKDLKKNLKRSSKNGLVYRDVEDYGQAIDLYIQHYATRMPHVTANHYNSFKMVCSIAYKQNMLLCRQAVNQHNEVQAIVLLFNDGKRLYNIMNTTTDAGRKTEANHFLINSLIKEFANNPLILDFEGSDLVGVKSFYENFGAVNQPYFNIKYNNLPWPLRLFK